MQWDQHKLTQTNKQRLTSNHVSLSRYHVPCPTTGHLSQVWLYHSTIHIIVGWFGGLCLGFVPSQLWWSTIHSDLRVHTSQNLLTPSQQHPTLIQARRVSQKAPPQICFNNGPFIPSSYCILSKIACLKMYVSYWTFWFQFFPWYMLCPRRRNISQFIQL